MKSKNLIVETAEFRLSDGSHIVWHKAELGWIITRYFHGSESKSTQTLGHLPSCENAIYFAKKLNVFKAK